MGCAAPAFGSRYGGGKVSSKELLRVPNSCANPKWYCGYTTTEVEARARFRSVHVRTVHVVVLDREACAKY